MEIVRGAAQLSHSLRHSVITIGNFDGVHLGHRQIIRTAREQADRRGGQLVAYTFRPHPQSALQPGRHLPLLSTYDEKLELLATLGVDLVIEEPFSREFSEVEPDQFFQDVLIHRLSAQAIVVGYDFSFGRERKGHIDVLEAFCRRAGVELTVVPPFRIEEEVVSSSKIRQHLLAGEIELGNRLLGRPFFYRGIVIKGEGRGRTLGFPTANLKVEDKLTLPYGVYAGWAMTRAARTSASDRCFKSVTNIGVRPTFHADTDAIPALIETHLLNTTIDLYGSTLEVQFVRRLRAEKRFNGPDELKAQILADAQAADQALS